MNKNIPLLITECPRSGKTMVAGALRVAGGFLGNVDKSEENLALTEYLRGIIGKLGGDPFGQKPIVPTSHVHIPKDFHERVMTILRSQGYREGVWVYKSSLITLTWPIWSFAFPTARYLIVRRRKGDIINSCMKTAYMDAYSDEEGWKKMIDEYEIKFVEMITEGLNCKVMWPERMSHGDYSQMYELLDWVGLPWRYEILAYIDPKFWKLRKKT